MDSLLCSSLPPFPFFCSITTKSISQRPHTWFTSKRLPPRLDSSSHQPSSHLRFILDNRDPRGETPKLKSGYLFTLPPVLSHFTRAESHNQVPKLLSLLTPLL